MKKDIKEKENKNTKKNDVGGKKTNEKKDKEDKKEVVPRTMNKVPKYPIVYLAWGSLLWDYHQLPVVFSPRPWQLTYDLEIPLEFSRISDKGTGRMTLVIDDVEGENNPVWYAPCLETNFNKAIGALRKREKTTSDNIAYLNLVTANYRVTNTPKEVVQKIIDWADKNEFRGVVWTDLPSNWTKIRNEPYSVEAGIDYYSSLSGETRILARDYILNAIKYAQIETPFSAVFLEKEKIE